jgi:ABC-type polysaccharide/polyol phosphate export permease
MLHYFAKMWACRYFWMSLVRIDLRSRYRRSILGVGWSLVRPLMLTVILCLVFQRLFRRADTWTYAPYILSGLALWDYVTTATKQGCQCFFQGESYIRQHPTPIAVFPLRTALTESFHFLIATVVLFGFAGYANGGMNAVALLSLVPTFAILFLLIWSLATLAGFANVYFQDTQHLMDVGFQILFYATPIIYYPKDLGEGSRLYLLVTSVNPLVPFFRLFRDPILYGQWPAFEVYATALLLVAFLGGLAAMVCAKLQRQLIFQL